MATNNCVRATGELICLSTDHRYRLCRARSRSLWRRGRRRSCALAVGEKVVITGGMVLDAGFVHGLWSQLITSENNVSLLISREGIFAGAYGAAVLAARRFGQISQSFGLGGTDPLAPPTSDRHDRSLN